MSADDDIPHRGIWHWYDEEHACEQSCDCRLVWHGGVMEAMSAGGVNSTIRQFGVGFHAVLPKMLEIGWTKMSL